MSPRPSPGFGARRGGSPGLRCPPRRGALRLFAAPGGASGDLRGPGGRIAAGSPDTDVCSYRGVRAGAARGAVPCSARTVPRPPRSAPVLRVHPPAQPLRRGRAAPAAAAPRGSVPCVPRVLRGMSGSVRGRGRCRVPRKPRAPAVPERGRWEAAVRMEQRWKEPPVPFPCPSCSPGTAVVPLPTRGDELWGQRRWPEGHSPKSWSRAPAPAPNHPLVLPLVLFLIWLGFFCGFIFFNSRLALQSRLGMQGGLSRGEGTEGQWGPLWVSSLVEHHSSHQDHLAGSLVWSEKHQEDGAGVMPARG